MENVVSATPSIGEASNQLPLSSKRYHEHEYFVKMLNDIHKTQFI